jgi:uncharacterized protein (DUF2236 family)
MADLLVRTRLEEYAAPRGDPGWFGPGSIAWQVHADLPSMLIGGLTALFLQTLHPLVMQGVEDHSNYREDPFGRLERTASFIAATTYGGDALARAFVRHVQQVHTAVRGVGPGGTAYRASDPSLLTYVHVTEVFSFLRSHQRYTAHPLVRDEKDRYVEEMSLVARRLGAREVPTTVREMRAYLHTVRPVLEGSAVARTTVRYLTTSPLGASLAARSAYAAISEAAVDLLPPWARGELGLFRPAVVRIGLVRPSAAVAVSLLRFVVGPSPILEAARTRATS